MKSIKEQLFSHHVQIYESNLAQVRDTNEQHSIDEAQVKDTHEKVVATYAWLQVLYSMVCELD